MTSPDEPEIQPNRAKAPAPRPRDLPVTKALRDTLSPYGGPSMRRFHIAAAALTGVLGLACSTGSVPDASGSGESFTGTSNGATTAPSSDTRDTESDTGHDTGDTGMSGPTCADGVLNQEETDVDCGGPNCGPCPSGASCLEHADCESESCVGGMCVDPNCSDGAQNGSETDVDCGGSCNPCDDNLGCMDAADCASGVCTNGVCTPPSCGDGVQNGDETDVDCGGGCSGCEEGESCNEHADCLSQFCDAGSCAPADCVDDGDCDSFDTACTEGVCDGMSFTCSAEPANNGQPCDDGDLCTDSENCQAGTCGGGDPVDCSNLSDDCNIGVCNTMDGQCEGQPANEGNSCDDGKSCTINEECTQGSCVDPDDPGYVFYEDFSGNAAGWSFGTEWAVGPAAASVGCTSCTGQDPSTDHTNTNDNRLAGVVIGGCATTVTHADYCITTPAIDTSGIAGNVFMTYWRHLGSDYPPFQSTHFDVSTNGNNWTQLWTYNGGCQNDVVWTQQQFNVTAYKSANFRGRWCYANTSIGVYTARQWSIDDVLVGPIACTPP